MTTAKPKPNANTERKLVRIVSSTIFEVHREHVVGAVRQVCRCLRFAGDGGCERGDWRGDVILGCTQPSVARLQLGAARTAAAAHAGRASTHPNTRAGIPKSSCKVPDWTVCAPR